MQSCFGTPDENRTHNCPLGVQSHCESFIKNVQFRAFPCVFVKNVRVFILKTLNKLRNFCIVK